MCINGSQSGLPTEKSCELTRFITPWKTKFVPEEESQSSHTAWLSMKRVHTFLVMSVWILI